MTNVCFSFVISLFLFQICMFANEALIHSNVNNALIYGAEAKIEFHVTDELGQPIENAKVDACFVQNDKGLDISLHTDKDGVAIIQNRCTGEIIYTISKENFYYRKGTIVLGRNIRQVSPVIKNRWQPFGETYPMVLKTIRNPIPLIAYYYIGTIPQNSRAIGFDLKVGDFVRPNGVGEVCDFFIKYNEEIRSFWEYSVSLSISFPNSMDGAYYMKKDIESELESTYEADVDAEYRKQIEFHCNHLDSKCTNDSSLTKNEYLIFRTRTRIDQNGNLVEAYYSKIYGPIEFIRGGLMFSAYMNPTPNDRNLEFDLSRNLSRKKHPFYRIGKP